jgi:hypothetical protein
MTRRSLSAGLLLVLALLWTSPAQATYTTPTVVSVGAVAANALAVTPALPANIRTNDLLLLFCETENQAISIATQNGGNWALITAATGTGVASAADAVMISVFFDRYNGTQTAPVTSDSGDHQLCRMMAIRGVPPSGTPWVIATGTTEAADQSWSFPSTSTTVANNLVVIVGAGSLPDATTTTEFGALTNANLSGITERVDNTTTAGTGGSLYAATGTAAAIGDYGASTLTSVTSAVKAMVSLGITGQDLGAAPHVQSANASNSGSATSIGVASPGNTTAGNLLVAAVAWGTTDVTPTVTDTQLNSWTEIGTHVFGNAAGVAMFYTTAGSSAANTVTGNFGSSVPNRGILIAEYSGTTTSLDVTAASAAVLGNTTVAAMTSTFATTTQANAVLVGVIGNTTDTVSTITPGAGYTERQEATSVIFQLQDATMVTAGGVDASFTNITTAITYIARLAAFKTPAAGGATPQRGLIGVGQ